MSGLDAVQPAMALLPGSSHFIVGEDPAYDFSGVGEHLYVEIEKEGLTTDQVAEALAKATGKGPRDIGYAGRKDRWGITRQWFSIHFGEAERLGALADHLSATGRAVVLGHTRHGNKLRLGHLAGNRFRLGLGGVATSGALQAGIVRLLRDGIVNTFGKQRFGFGGATLEIARAWALRDATATVQWMVDPSGAWRYGMELPAGFRSGPEGRVLGALRHGASPEAALRGVGDQLRKLAASAAQSAVFNAIVAERQRLGLLHTARVGDLAMTVRGAVFTVTADEFAATNVRAAPGSLDARMTAPLPGATGIKPAPAVEAEERAWSAPTGVDWAWFDDKQPLNSPGERRPVVISFRAAPTITVGAQGAPTWLEFSLPSGAYATEVLAQLGITVPEDRRGTGVPIA